MFRVCFDPLAIDQKTAVRALPPPATKRQLRGFLGMFGFCHIWIASVALYMKLWREKGNPFSGVGSISSTLRLYKDWVEQSTSTGASKFRQTLHPIHERAGTALGVLTQKLGADQRPVAYFSKQFYSVALGCPSCLQAWAAWPYWSVSLAGSPLDNI